MKIFEIITMNEISWASGIPKIQNLNFNDSNKIGRWENRDFYLLEHGSEMFIFFVNNNKELEAYITLDNNGEDRHNLVRMENISGPKGSITALILFTISHLKLKLKIDKHEGLTPDGFKWLIKLIKNGGRGIKISDQNGNNINISNLKKEYHNSYTSTDGEQTSIYLDEGTNRKVILQDKKTGILDPAYRYLYDNRIEDGEVIKGRFL